MKLIGFDSNYGSASDTPQPVLLTFPDSCLIHAGKPAFLPPLGAPDSVWISAAVRICRLGKCIDESFASRYFDAACVGASIRAEGLLAQLQEKGLPWDAATCFDGSIAVGRFTPVDAADSPLRGFQVRVGDEVVEWDPELLHHGVAQAVSIASEFRTLKMGDIVFVGFKRACAAEIGSIITAFPRHGEAEQLLRLPIR